MFTPRTVKGTSWHLDRDESHLVFFIQGKLDISLADIPKNLATHTKAVQMGKWHKRLEVSVLGATVP